MIVSYAHECAGLQSSEHNLVYFPILKNAHTWAEKFFSTNFNMNTEIRKTTENSSVVLKDKVVLVILRDPLLRWLTGATQYFIDSKSVKLLDDPTFQNTIKDVVRFDDHTSVQLLNLMGVDIDKAVFFNCNPQLEENINLFSKFWFGKDTVSVGSHQVMTDNPNKIVIYNKLKNIAKNDSNLLKQIQSFYAMDYKLISTVSDRFFDKNTMEYYNTLRKMYD